MLSRRQQRKRKSRAERRARPSMTCMVIVQVNLEPKREEPHRPLLTRLAEVAAIAAAVATLLTLAVTLLLYFNSGPLVTPRSAVRPPALVSGHDEAHQQ